MTVSLIVAVARNGVIGRDGDLPWRLPDDQKRFRELTTGHHVIMGRKTWESIGKPLPRRTSVVLSRTAGFAPAGCVVVGDLDEALALARASGDDEAFVIGGTAVYALALPRADRVYLTRVDADLPGDAHFPPFEKEEWREVRREVHPADERHAHAFTLSVLERVAPRGAEEA
jgi:dihydrofolate reductase